MKPCSKNALAGLCSDMKEGMQNSMQNSMQNREIKGYVSRWMEEHKKEIYDLSDYMWNYPELGLEEYETSKRMMNLAKEHGFQIEKNIGGLPTAFVASFGTGGVTVGVNVEYDCLPGMSQKKTVMKHSPVIQGAPGQGCGHNVLGPAGLLAGFGLKAAIDEYQLPITVKLFGSPYEESSVGKPVMGKSGAYQGVDFFLDWHPLNYNRADYDRCNSVFIVQYSFEGKTCHGAFPWEGRSALDAGMLFSHAVEMLREHIIPGNPEAAHTINYTFSDTGPAFANIVPDTTSIILYGRFQTLEIAEDALKRIHLCAKGAAIATQTKESHRLITFTHPKLPNKTLADVVHKNLEETGTPQYTEAEQDFVKKIQNSLGEEMDGLETKIEPFQFRESIITDASEYSWNAPYASFELALGPKGGWHNWAVTACSGSTIGKKCIDKAARILAGSAIDIALDQELLKSAKKEMKDRLSGKKYESLIPDQYTPPFHFNQAVMEHYYPERKGIYQTLEKA